ncbi:MAG: NAD(P)/FAD-dependent oxidoreductase [Ignavibacteriae bacterium]|nr:NAD(P)/FAD-dependent oxidoreductase [Ignavibacteriota bacterium]
MKVGIIGGGAAGFFSAVTIAETNKSCEITILEKSPNVLAKVRVSGGGRCNVTNSLTDVKEFVKNYPRGNKELLSVFTRFGNADTINWFENHGVKLKAEPDGRMFPVSNNSQTIIDLFLHLAKKHNINIVTGFDVNEIIHSISKGFEVKSRNGESHNFDKLLVAPGGFSTSEKYRWIESLGHTIVEPVPSLFTFNCKDTLLRDLQGVSTQNAELKITGTKLSAKGDLLITHWGFSGPAILKLSAFGARVLSESDYKFSLEIKWTETDVQKEIEYAREDSPLKQIPTFPFHGFSRRFWEALILKTGINTEKRWNELSKKETEKLILVLTKSIFAINGKSTFKEEFVTAGGVNRKEIDFRTMQSKIVPNLFFAGEILDIDGITGGFNFQSAWSAGYIAGCEMAK